MVVMFASHGSGRRAADSKPTDPGSWRQVADLPVQLAKDVDAYHEVDYLNVAEADLAAEHGSDLESIDLRCGGDEARSAGTTGLICRSARNGNGSVVR